MRLFYNFALFCILTVYLTKALFVKKYRQNLAYRLGLKLPDIKKTQKPNLWIHACSVGETKAASVLAPHFKTHAIIFSNTTQTGHETAKKLIPNAQHIYLPLDFPWAIKRLLKRAKPDLLLFTESDIWPNLIKYADCKTALVSGVLSKRSYKRYKKFPFAAKFIYGPLNLICVQNELYQKRFESLGIKTHITGNLKMDIKTPQSTPEDFAITIGSTHPNEEEALLKALLPLTEKYPQIKLYIVPRHPERFELVEKLLKSSPATPICKMDVLQKQFSRSKLAIVAGSFIGNIGGHNILEPIFQHIPVLYGPQIHKQQELHNLVTSAKAGKQTTLETIAADIEKYITDPDHYTNACKAAKTLDSEVRGVTIRTLKELNQLLT